MRALLATRRRLLQLFSVLSCGLLFAQTTGGESATAPASERPVAFAAPVDLEAAERSVFSQFGEDGVIEKIFEIIEPGPKFCIEFGAHDGIKNSNMRNLVVNHGWASYQIEGNPKRAAQLAKNYAAYPKVKTEQARVYREVLEAMASMKVNSVR